MTEDSCGSTHLVGSLPAGNPFDRWPEFRAFLKLNFNVLQRLAGDSFKLHGKGVLVLQRLPGEKGLFEIAYATLDKADIELLTETERAEFGKCRPPHEFLVCVFDDEGRGYGLRLVNRAIISAESGWGKPIAVPC
jgi:hypothetical protein